MQRNKIAIVHPQLGWGGSEAVALWALAALKDDYEVSLITSGRVDIQRLNEFYGTSLAPEEFSILLVPLPFGLRKTTKLATLRGRFVQRYCQRVASRFDLMISAYNPCVFGVKGIQLVADLAELPTILPLHNWKRWWYGSTPLRRAYLKLCDRISPADATAWEENVSLANSNWTAELIRRDYGVAAGVLYPPVSGDAATIPYGERERGFVCIGRIIPEKRIETIVDILDAVRGRGHNIHLHIVGDLEGNNHYARRLMEHYLERNPDWVSFEGRLDERSKNELIGKHRFGISGRKDEPFGIAVAEMVKAGCIVFVPNGGGQVEIVDHASLVFDDENEAVDKICRVLEDTPLRNDLRAHLTQGMHRFSVEAFQEGIRQTVNEFFEQRSRAG
jgi:glycosyltransferase involved in cell wall biosynthesis